MASRWRSSGIDQHADVCQDLPDLVIEMPQYAVTDQFFWTA